MLKPLRVKGVLSPRFHRLAKELFWIGLGQALAVLGAIMGVRLLTQVLNPTQYGELALGLTVVGLVTQLAFGPFQQGVLRFFGPAQEANELHAYLVSVRVLFIRASVFIVGIAGVVLFGLWVSGHVKWIALVATALVLALISGYERVLDSMQSAARQRAVTAWHQALAQWLRFLVAFGLMVWWGASSSIAMLGYLMATIAVLISQFMFFRYSFGTLILSQSYEQIEVKKWAERLKDYAWPFMTWGLFAWVQQSSDRWALQTFSHLQDVGYYAVLYQLGYMPIILVTGIITQFLQPILFARAGAGTDTVRVKRARQLNHQVIIAFIALTVLGTSVAAALHAHIFALLVGPEYRGVSQFMPWMVLSGGLFASSEVMALLFMSGVNTKILITPKIVTAVSGILLNTAGAFWLGLRGVVFASIGFSSVSLIGMFVLSLHSKRVELRQGEERA